MPGTSPTRIGNARWRTAARLPRLCRTTQLLIASSTRTKAGLKTFCGRNKSAIGTVSDEKPYPSAPLTVAANSATIKRVTRPKSKLTLANLSARHFNTSQHIIERNWQELSGQANYMPKYDTRTIEHYHTLYRISRQEKCYMASFAKIATLRDKL